MGNTKPQRFSIQQFPLGGGGAGSMTIINWFPCVPRLCGLITQCHQNRRQWPRTYFACINCRWEFLSNSHQQVCKFASLQVFRFFLTYMLCIVSYNMLISQATEGPPRSNNTQRRLCRPIMTYCVRKKILDFIAPFIEKVPDPPDHRRFSLL